MISRSAQRAGGEGSVEPEIMPPPLKLANINELSLCFEPTLPV